MLNREIEQLKCPRPVRVHSQVRLLASLKSLPDLSGIAKAEVEATMEIKDERKPAFTAVLVLLYHFK